MLEYKAELEFEGNWYTLDFGFEAEDEDEALEYAEQMALMWCIDWYEDIEMSKEQREACIRELFEDVNIHVTEK